MSVMKYGKIQKMTAALLFLLMMMVSQCGSAQAVSVDTAVVQAAPLASGTITKDGMVRVYLSSLGNVTSLDLTVRGNYSLSYTGEFIENGSRVHIAVSPSNGQITLTFNGRTVQPGRSFSLRRHSASGTNGILIDQSRDSQNPYPGDLAFEAVHNGQGYILNVIAHIYIENYLYGVLPYEMGNSSGMEALKAQAVAARTYTVRMMKSRAGGKYDVKDTTSDQVYRGTPSGNANCVAAVDATKGIVLMHGSDYITTYYSSSNGGQTETARTGTAYSYMKVKDDPFDYANPNSTVKKKTIYADLTSDGNPSGLIELLRNKAVASLQRMGYPAYSGNTKLLTLKNVVPHTPMYSSPSRLYTKLDFIFALQTVNPAGQNTNITLTETCGIFTELEGLLGMGIQSSANELWSVEKKNNTFILQARRFGHGMGMSQRGAMYMAKLGYSYEEILGFYYDGSRRVKHSFTNSILTASGGDQYITVEPPVGDEEGNTPFDPSGSKKQAASVTTDSGSLNLRSQPNINSLVITTIPRQAVVEVVEHGETWTKVRYRENTGYVMTRYLTFSPNTSSQPSDTEMPKALVVTPGGALNLRAQPFTGSQLLAQIPQHTLIDVLKKGEEWSMVNHQGIRGYVMNKFLSFDLSAMPSEPDAEEDTKDELIQDESNLKTAYVNTASGSLNLRLKPALYSGVLVSIPRQEKVSVTAYGDEWCGVRYNAYNGYVMTRYLKFAENYEQLPFGDDERFETALQIPAWVVTESGSLNLRQAPSGYAGILCTIPRHAQVTITNKENDWYYVTYGDRSGYVMSRYLSTDKPFAAHDQNSTQGSNTESPEQVEDAQPHSPYVEIGDLILDITLEAPQEAMYAETIGRTFLYSMCSYDSAASMEIPAGESVEIVLLGDLWCRVEYCNEQGYCPREQLNVRE